MPTVYQLTYSHNSNVVTRWLVDYEVHNNGALVGTDVHGRKRIVGSGMPFSLAERDDVPPDVDVNEELMEAHGIAEEELAEQ